MAEEFQAAICGESWWNIINPTRSVFPLMPSTCSVAAADAGNYSTWQSTTDFVDLKGTRSCAEETDINLVSSDTSLSFLDAEKPHQSGTGSILIDSTLQMMGFGMSSSTSPNWSQSLLGSSFDSVLQEETGIGGGGSSNDSQIQKDWSPKNFSSDGGSEQVSTVDAFKPMNQEFSLNQQSLNSVVTSTDGSLSGGNFPVVSASYGYPSTLIQSLYEHQPQPQNSLFTNPSMSYGTCSNELSPTWSKVSSFLKPLMPKQQLRGLHFSNNTTPFWNSSAEALNDIRAGVFASSQAQYQTPKFEEKPNCPHTLLKKLKREESPDAAKKNSPEPAAFKRQRIETPSPLPTFKVRKEKLGDRITALQQLVSPFGKTDTASVLHEAIEYIKFLHDQVSVLRTPYMKNNGAPIQHQQDCDNLKDSEGPKQDLRSRGLCLVPVSSTFPVANETIVDFWTPTFGGALIGK
ncbi:Transcription factor bHLH123 [Glycine soja]